VSAPDPLAWIDEELAAWAERGLQRKIVTRQGPQAAHAHVGEQRLINFSSNDYLGLAADGRLGQAVGKAIEGEGWGSGASPLITGHGHSHQLLAERLADFLGTEAALVFSSGFAANVGTITALVGRGDAVFSDQRNHASLIDGCRLSRAEVYVYPHCDTAGLETLLKQTSDARRRLIVSDTVFSMEGDRAPLADLVEISRRYEAMLMVDEAHATGVFGGHGRGLAEEVGVESQIPIRAGTLSKALGCAGGFVAGRRSLVEWLANRARPYVFSTAQPSAGSAAAIAALDIVRDEPHRRIELLQRATLFREALSAQGWNVGRSDSQIVPLIVGDVARTMQLAGCLRERGLLVPPIRPPSVPEGHALLRISLSYAHTPKMLDKLVTTLSALSDRA